MPIYKIEIGLVPIYKIESIIVMSLPYIYDECNKGAFTLFSAMSLPFATNAILYTAKKGIHTFIAIVVIHLHCILT